MASLPSSPNSLIWEWENEHRRPTTCRLCCECKEMSWHLYVCQSIYLSFCSHKCDIREAWGTPCPSCLPASQPHSASKPWWPLLHHMHDISLMKLVQNEVKSWAMAAASSMLLSSQSSKVDYNPRQWCWRRAGGDTEVWLTPVRQRHTHPKAACVDDALSSQGLMRNCTKGCRVLRDHPRQVLAARHSRPRGCDTHTHAPAHTHTHTHYVYNK